MNIIKECLDDYAMAAGRRAQGNGSLGEVLDARSAVQAAIKERLNAKDAEIATLRACLKTANSMAEEFERKWYLRGDEVESKEAEIAALKAANLKLETLCDATYVAQGADAYNHACSEMEAWQAKRRKAGKEVGTEGSLCDGMAWVYGHLSTQEVEIAALSQDAKRGRYMIEHGGWQRDDRDRQTTMTTLVPYGSDLSCLALRRDAVDKAMAHAVQPKVQIYPGGGLAHDPLADVCGVAAHVRNVQAVKS